MTAQALSSSTRMNPRPDAIDWTSTTDHATLAFLPRQRMHRAIWRWMILLLVMQVVASIGVFALLHRAEPLPRDNASWLDRVLDVREASRRMAVEAAVSMMLGGGCAALLLLPLVHLRLRRWARDLHDLHTAIRRLAHTAQPAPVAIGGQGEVAYLAIAFNDMAGRLLAGRRALMEANEDLEHGIRLRTNELRAANAELDRKNGVLAQVTDTALKFTDDVAHEFRTPLTVISEFASIISDGLGGPVTDKQTEYLRFITGASRDLAQLVDDFLDSSKLRAGRLRVDRRGYSVEEIIESAWPMLEVRAAGSEIVLQKSIDPDVPRVFCDIDKARRALVNLVVNAVKFSPARGVVAIGACCGDFGGVEISITDHGRGLPPEELAALFQRFKQGREAHRSNEKGFGLGLNIVRDLVAMNLGSVSVQSEVGRGSAFAFTLPPDEPEIVLDWYFRQMAERAPDAMLSVLRVDRDCEVADVNELLSFIASVTYPADLQLAASDGRSVISIGETIEPARWRDRLLRHDEDHRQSRGEPAAPLRVQCLGTRPVGEARALILPQLAVSPAMEVHACA